MYFRFNNYTHPIHECIVTFFGVAPVFNPRGTQQRTVRRMVVEGEIIADGVTSIDSRVAEIKAAYAVGGGAAVLLTSTGTPTQFNLSAGSLTGVRVVSGPNFTTQDGKAHYATGLPFSVTLEAEYQYNDEDPLVFYQETITHVGTGGPRRVTVELDQGNPIEQIVSTNTPVYVIQSGEAVGSLAYPNVNGPIFPTQVDLPDGLQLSKGTPRLDGNGWVDWPVRWNYRMTLLRLENIPNPLLR